MCYWDVVVTVSYPTKLGGLGSSPSAPAKDLIRIILNNMKQLIFSLLLLVACGNEEYTSIDGKWRIVQQQGIVEGYLEIKGDLVVFAEFSADGVDHVMTEPQPVEPYRIVVDNDESPRGSLYFEGWVPNGNFTRIDVVVTAVRMNNGGLQDFDDIYLVR